MRVSCSIAPLAFAVKAIGGDRVSIVTLLTPGQSPATYEPTAKQMVELSKSKCLFAVGVPFETQVVSSISASMPNLRVIDSTAGIDKRTASFNCDHEHNGHGYDYHHAHESDPHIWMSPRLMCSIAENIHDALLRLDPSGRDVFARNFIKLKESLYALDASISKTLAPLQGRAFYVYHPSLGYFADAYGLEQIAIEQGGKEPTAKELDALVQRAKGEGVKLIFVQPQFSQRAAKSVVQQIGGVVVPLNPLAMDYIANLKRITDQIQKALQPGRHDTDG